MTIPIAATKDKPGVLVNAAAVEELKAQFGVENPDNLADILMYFLPPSVIGNAYALVLVLGTLSVYGDMWYMYLSLAHRVISPPLSD